VIEVHELKKSYEDFEAVRGVSFDVEAGAIFGFIGPNGAGKTTTIRILATLLEPTSGYARVDGKDVLDSPEAVRCVLGYMPDQDGVYEGISVYEYLDFYSAAYRIPRRARRRSVHDVMELTDLAKLQRKLVSDLSKGMKQRLCLAKTLVHDPKVLVLDEPANGLDPRARIELRALLKELSAMGKTIVISSHILTELSDFCTHVGIIEQGELLASGPIAEVEKKIARAPAKEQLVTTKLILRVARDGARAKATLAAHPLVESVDGRADDEVSVVMKGGDADVHKLIRAVLDADLQLVEVVKEKQDLESLFMAVTKGDVQ
jgi:ABC-2 type transport system ATP-binding protein